MRTRILPLLITMLFALSLASNAAANENSKMTPGTIAVVNNPDSNDRLNLRTNPSPDAPTLGKYYNGTYLEVLSNEKNGWCKVSIFYLEGYMMAKFLVYPEQLEAAVKLMQGHNIRVDFPMDQSCCGLPVVMMGQRETARDVALQNMDAFEKGDYDVILTLCASCASQLKEGYVELFAGQPGRQARAKALADKVMDFSTFAKEKLGLSAESFNHSDEKVTYHATCHLCRGLGVKEAPRELIAAAADYVPAAEEEVCCGFGGTYSAKFPEVSAALLRKKLDGIADTGAARVVMDCPGCVLQIRGGAEKDGKGLKVTHISELLAENLKK